MAEISIGAAGEAELLVTGEEAISFLGTDGPRVLSTPQMIRYMERTCRDTVLPLLDAGYDTLGTHVDIWHHAAAAIGATVKFRAEITSVSGRRVEFRVEAWDGNKMIGEGLHERTIIDVAKFAARMAEKKP